MTTPVIITPAAELDLAESRDWYESIRAGLSRDFELAFGAGLFRIARYPHAYDEVGHGLRRALLKRFPHAVFYRKSSDGVHVVAAFHLSRHSRLWHSRAR